MSVPKEHKIVAVAQLISAVGLGVFWLIYYFRPAITSETEGYRFVFDTTSLLPDLLLAVLLCFSAYSLLQGKESGRRLSLLVACSMIYLGVLDVGIPIQGSVFALSIIDITGSGALNLWCVVLGLYSIVKLKKNTTAGTSPD